MATTDLTMYSSDDELMTELNFLGAVVVDVEIRKLDKEDHESVAAGIIWDLYQVIPKDWGVYTLGSVAIGIAGPASDIDLYIDQGNIFYTKQLDREDVEHLQHFLLYTLLTKNGIEGLFAIKRIICCNARVPLISCIHLPTGRKVDISCTNGLAVENSKLLRLYLSSDSRVKWLVVVVHEWAKAINVLGNGPAFRPYALTWLVLFVLMRTSPPVVPPLTSVQAPVPLNFIAGWDCRIPDKLPKTKNTQNKIQLLIGFLQSIVTLDYQNQVICPLTGDFIPKKTFDKPNQLPFCMNPYEQTFIKNKVSLNTKTALCLQDPLELAHNITKTVQKHKVVSLVKMCRESLAANQLVCNADQQLGNKSTYSYI